MGYTGFSLEDSSSRFIPEIRVVESETPILACGSAELFMGQV
jgi:hypothetical protein